MSKLKWKYNRETIEYTSIDENLSFYYINKINGGFCLERGVHWIGIFKRLKDAKQVAELIARG